MMDCSFPLKISESLRGDEKDPGPFQSLALMPNLHRILSSLAEVLNSNLKDEFSCVCHVRMMVRDEGDFSLIKEFQVSLENQNPKVSILLD